MRKLCNRGEVHNSKHALQLVLLFVQSVTQGAFSVLFGKKGHEHDARPYRIELPCRNTAHDVDLYECANNLVMQ